MIRNFWISIIFILIGAWGGWCVFDIYLQPILAPVPDYVWQLIMVSFLSEIGWHFLHKFSQ